MTCYLTIYILCPSIPFYPHVCSFCTKMEIAISNLSNQLIHVDPTLLNYQFAQISFESTKLNGRNLNLIFFKTIPIVALHCESSKLRSFHVKTDRLYLYLVSRIRILVSWSSHLLITSPIDLNVNWSRHLVVKTSS